MTLFRERKTSRTFVTILSYRPHPQYRIILRDLDGRLCYQTDGDNIRPEWLLCRSPDNFVPGDSGRAIQVPRQCAVVGKYGCVDPNVGRCTWSLCQRPDGCAVDFGDARDKVEVDKFDEIAELFTSGVDADVLVLVCKVFMRFSEASCWVALCEERLVIASSKESISAIYNAH